MTPENASVRLLEAAPNFRDFGGYITRSGRRVRPGRLYRSELLLDLSARDLHLLSTLDIRLVCDLRSPSERHHIGNDWPVGCSFERLALDEDESLSAVQPEKWSRRLADPAFDAARARAALIDNYQRMPASFAGDLRALFERIAQPNSPPVLVHCAAGKDRTGFVCAMLLWALDVPRDTIFADYLATLSRFGYERLVGTRLRLLLNTDQIPAHAEAPLRVLSSVHPDFLQASLDALVAQHGSVEAYLERVCGLDTTRRQAFQDALLEA